jgi:phytanoyl-CoA hydroxylase
LIQVFVPSKVFTGAMLLQQSLSPQKVESFSVNGFVKGEKVISDAQAEQLAAEVRRVVDNRDEVNRDHVRVRNLNGNAASPVWQIVNIWQVSQPFKELLTNSKLIEQVVQLMENQFDAKEIRLFHDQIQFKPAEGGGVNMWHQDSPLWPVLQPKNAQLTAWIALDDVDEENGCMSMVPHSHNWGSQMDTIAQFAGWNGLPTQWEGHSLIKVACPVEKGTVHFHHPLTWHGSPQNLSARPRRAVALHFMTERTVFDATGNHVMQEFIEAAHGEKVVGDAFPLVWSA